MDCQAEVTVNQHTDETLGNALDLTDNLSSDHFCSDPQGDWRLYVGWKGQLVAAAPRASACMGFPSCTGCYSVYTLHCIMLSLLVLSALLQHVPTNIIWYFCSFTAICMYSLWACGQHALYSFMLH